MFFRSIGLAFVILFVGLWDATVLPWMPGWFRACELTLPLFLLLTIYADAKKGILVGFFGGMITDLFLPSQGGFLPIRYALVAGILRVASRYLFTNRSLWGMIVFSCIGVGVDRILLWFFESIQIFFGRIFVREVHTFWYGEVIWVAFVSCATFLALVVFSRRFLPLISRFGNSSGRSRLF